MTSYQTGWQPLAGKDTTACFVDYNKTSSIATGKLLDVYQKLDMSRRQVYVGQRLLR